MYVLVSEWQHQHHFVKREFFRGSLRDLIIDGCGPKVRNMELQRNAMSGRSSWKTLGFFPTTVCNGSQPCISWRKIRGKREEQGRLLDVVEELTWTWRFGTLWSLWEWICVVQNSNATLSLSCQERLNVAVLKGVGWNYIFILMLCIFPTLLTFTRKTSC